MKLSEKSLPIWQKILLFSIGGIGLIVLLIIYNIWRTGDRFFNAVTGLLQLESLFVPIETPSSIVQKIQGVQELTTTIYTMETIIPTSADRRWGEFSIATTNLLYIGRGEVRAGIDLSQLTEGDIQVNSDRIQINLPPAQILDSKVDINRSRVYDYDRGFLNLGPDVAPQLQTLAQRKTLAEVISNACSEGILETANQRAKETITQLIVVTEKRPLQIQTSSSDCQQDLITINH